MTPFNVLSYPAWSPFTWPGVTAGALAAYSAYAVLSLEPDLVLDFASEYYRKSGATTTLASATTYTGASNGTMTDSDGLLKWRPHNRMRSSGDLNGAGWANNSMTVGAVTTGSPFGTYQTVSPSSTIAGASSRYQIGLPLTNETTYVGWSLVKYSAGNGWFVLDLYDSGKGSERSWFDVQNGVVGTKDPLIIDHGMINYGDGWWLCWASSASTNVSGGLSVEVPAGDGVLASNSGDVVLVAGSQFNRSDLGGMVNNPATNSSYVPTTSAAVYLPRTGNHVYNGTAWVNEGLLLESEPRTNFLSYSGDFSQWLKGSVTTVTAGFTGPDGGSNAYRVEMPRGGGTFLRLASTLVTGSEYTFSIYVKDNGTGSQFTLDNGITSTPLITATDEWVRYSITFAAPSITVYANIDNGSHFSGTDLLIYGAQVEAGSTPSSYIPTAGATVTRAAETLTVAAADMPWPTPVVIGDELVTNGTFDTDLTGWTTSSADWTWDASARMRLNTTTNYQSVSYDTNYLAGGMQVGVPYLIEFDYELVSGSFGFSLNSTNAYATAVSTLGSGRFSLEIVRPADNRTDMIQLRNQTATTEVYIDNISVKEINPIAVSIQMDGQMTYADLNEAAGAGSAVAGPVQFYSWGSGSNNYVAARLATDSGSGQVRFQQEESSVVDAVLSGGSVLSAGVNTSFNVAGRHGSTFINGAVDGTALTANTTPSALPDLSATDFQIGSTFMGNIGKVRVWADDIGDTGIAEAST